jgi:hypothetical protein
MVFPMMRAALLCLLLSACATFPQVDAASRNDGPTPSLLPWDDLQPPPSHAANADLLAARQAALRARAAALRSQ